MSKLATLQASQLVQLAAIRALMRNLDGDQAEQCLRDFQAQLSELLDRAGPLPADVDEALSQQVVSIQSALRSDA